MTVAVKNAGCNYLLKIKTEFQEEIMKTGQKQQGFTLIEIAIVLVIIGLLLGGVLKGQELITAARVRNLAAQLDGVKIAYLGFQDRYRALPGDYPLGAPNANIPGPTGNATVGCAGANRST